MAQPTQPTGCKVTQSGNQTIVECASGMATYDPATSELQLTDKSKAHWLTLTPQSFMETTPAVVTRLDHHATDSQINCMDPKSDKTATLDEPRSANLSAQQVHQAAVNSTYIPYEKDKLSSYATHHPDIIAALKNTFGTKPIVNLSAANGAGVQAVSLQDALMQSPATHYNACQNFSPTISPARTK